MITKRTKRCWIANLAIAASAGVMFEMNCSTTDLRVLMAGLEAVSRTLEGAETEDDSNEVNFGDYLIGELND